MISRFALRKQRLRARLALRRRLVQLTVQRPHEFHAPLLPQERLHLGEHGLRAAPQAQRLPPEAHLGVLRRAQRVQRVHFLDGAHGELRIGLRHPGEKRLEHDDGLRGRPSRDVLLRAVRAAATPLVGEPDGGGAERGVEFGGDDGHAGREEPRVPVDRGEVCAVEVGFEELEELGGGYGGEFELLAVGLGELLEVGVAHDTGEVVEEVEALFVRDRRERIIGIDAFEFGD
mmetsp:Transcript_2988/g.7808  ORF Transcript_2988/g.7808 Transcript_2988/m.7808 type:complete len:231 (+) Transcript_2988:760-1452(+)